MTGELLVLIILHALSIQAFHVNPTRVRRGIFGTYTHTQYITTYEYRYVPNSCIHVAPDLPDCRNVRFMTYDYPKFDSSAFKFLDFGNQLFSTTTANPTKDSNITVISKRNGLEENSTASAQGWGEYLGFYIPTVTKTVMKILPTTVKDSRIMVTYDVRGCKPHDLPDNIERCNNENSLETYDTIEPSIPIKHEIQATKLPELPRSISVDIQGTEAADLEDVEQVSTKNVSKDVVDGGTVN